VSLQSRSIRNGLFAAVFLWWFPLIGPSITGLVIGFTTKRNPASLVSAVIVSAVMSLLTSVIYFYVIKVPFLGNLLPFTVVLFNILGSILCVSLAFLIPRKATFSTLTPSGVITEFYVKHISEVDSMLGNYVDLSACSQPLYSVSEDMMKVRRECRGFVLNYEVKKEGSGYRVQLNIGPS
jgi:hypothetical protein